MDSWRRVEIAACEELPGLLGESGPTEAELDAIRGATFTVEEVAERERLTAAGGLDAILSIVQMPPGVPVACVGLDNARNAAILAAQILGC